MGMSERGKERRGDTQRSTEKMDEVEVQVAESGSEVLCRSTCYRAASARVATALSHISVLPRFHPNLLETRARRASQCGPWQLGILLGEERRMPNVLVFRRYRPAASEPYHQTCGPCPGM